MEPCVENEKKSAKKRSHHPKDSSKHGHLKRPATAFILFSNEQRRIISKERPHLQLGEMSKVLADCWSKLSAEEKQPYLARSQDAKQQYMKQLQLLGLSAKKRHRSLSPNSSSPQKKKHDSRTKDQTLDDQQSLPHVPEVSQPSSSSSIHPVILPGTGISVFTEQFLQHNKDLESQLTHLRRGNHMLEDEVAMLEQGHTDKKATLASLKKSTAEYKQCNVAMENKLDEIHSLIASSFSSLSFTEDDNEMRCTKENVTESLTHLQKMLEEGENRKVKEKAMEISRQLRKDITALLASV